MMTHTYYTQCDNCGSLLDPGEVCDCKTEPQQIVDIGTIDLTKAAGDLRHMDTDFFFDLLSENYSAG